MASSSLAQKTWEMENNMEFVSSVDAIFSYNGQEQQEILSAKPWTKEWVLKTQYYIMTVVVQSTATGIIELRVIWFDIT